MKHTPGPWIADGNTVLLNNRPEYRELIATTARMMNPNANARLIAAAPDLLEACEAALEQFELILRATRNDLTQAGIDAVGERIIELRAALAKAKGE